MTIEITPSELATIIEALKTERNASMIQSERVELTILINKLIMQK